MFEFLGGAAFRLIFGGIMDFVKARQQHQIELEMLQKQAELEAAKADRQRQMVELQAKLQVQQIVVQSDAEEKKAMADAFVEAVKATNSKTGIALIDAWNASIRPAGATIALVSWMAMMIITGHLVDFDKTLILEFLGVFVGDRIHTKGKLF